MITKRKSDQTVSGPRDNCRRYIGILVKDTTLMLISVYAYAVIGLYLRLSQLRVMIKYLKSHLGILSDRDAFSILFMIGAYLAIFVLI